MTAKNYTPFLRRIIFTKIPWNAYFVVKWNDTIADCSVSRGSIECYYPVGLANED